MDQQSSFTSSPIKSQAAVLPKKSALMVNTDRELDESFQTEALMRSISDKYMTEMQPGRQLGQLENLQLIAKRLHQSGFCRRILERKDCAFKFRREKECIFHVSDLWGKRQEKLLLDRVGLNSKSVKALVSRVGLLKAKPIQKALAGVQLQPLKPILKLPSLRLSPNKPKWSTRDLSVRLDKVITDCDIERSLLQHSFSTKSQSKGSRTIKAKLKGYEQKKLRYYLSVL
jgi:hypothetical protein